MLLNERRINEVYSRDFLSFINIYIAYLMYKLNKKENNPKISFEPHINFVHKEKYSKKKSMYFYDELEGVSYDIKMLEGIEGNIKGFPHIEHDEQEIL